MKKIIYLAIFLSMCLVAWPAKAQFSCEELLLTGQGLPTGQSCVSANGQVCYDNDCLLSGLQQPVPGDSPASPAPASSCGGSKDFGWVVCTINQKVITPLIGLLVAAAMLFFMWGLIKYLGGDAKNKEEAKGVMWFSVLAMFVMFSIWGLVRVLMATLDITGEEAAPIPRVYP